MSLRVVLLALVVLAPLPAAAGPCAKAIDDVQASVNAYVDRMAGAGNSGKESTSATMRRQPTPDSVAQAEADLGDGKTGEKALAALQRARKLDAAGDQAGCTKALDKARKLIGA